MNACMYVCMYVCMCVCGDVAVVFRTGEEFSFLTPIFQTNNTGWKKLYPMQNGGKERIFFNICTYVCM